MNPDQLWETTLDPDARTLMQVQYKDLWKLTIYLESLWETMLKQEETSFKKFALEAEIDCKYNSHESLKKTF